MFPFSITHKIDKRINNNKVYMNALKGKIQGYELKVVKRNVYELVLNEKSLFSNPMFEIYTEIEYKSDNIKIISYNSWGIVMATAASIAIFIPCLISILKGYETESWILFIIPIVWMIIPPIYLFNYLFRISIIKEIIRKIEEVNDLFHL